MKKISVVVSHYNRLELLNRCIKSVLLQGDQIGEIIIIDDCSPNLSTKAIIRSLPESGLIKVHQLEINSGSQAARNHGIRLAMHEYVALLDCDDEWLPGKISTQIVYLEGNKLDIVTTSFFKCYDGITRIKERSPRYTGSASLFLLARGGHMQTSTIVARRAVFKHVSFRTEVKKFQDWDFILRAESLGFKIGHIDRRLSIYHFGHNDQMTTLINPDYFKNFLYRLSPQLDDQILFLAKTRTLSRMLIECGRIHEGINIFLQAQKDHRQFDILGAIKLLRKILLFITKTIN